MRFRRVQYDSSIVPRLGIVTETPRISLDYYNFEQRRWILRPLLGRISAIWYPIFYGPREYAAVARLKLDEQSEYTERIRLDMRM